MERKRIFLFDNLKVLLLFLVVVGHIYDLYLNDSAFFRVIYVFVYLFHMPLFVFVSGYLSKNINKPIKDLLSTLIIPYLVFNSIWYLINLYLSGESTFSIFTPYAYLWYLVSLFSWRVLLKYLIRIPYILPISFLIAVLAGFLPIDRFLSLSRTMTFLPFFLLGFYCQKDHIDKIKRIPKSIAVIVLTVGFILAVAFVNMDINKEILWLIGPYSKYELTNFEGVLTRVLFYIVCIALSLAVFRFVSNKEYSISTIGRNTMVIYLGHMFARIVMSKFFPAFEESLTANIIIIVSPIIVFLILSLPIFNRMYDYVFNNLLSLDKKKSYLNKSKQHTD